MSVDSIASSAEPREVNDSFNQEQHSGLEQNVDEQRGKIYVPPQISVFKPVVSASSWTIYDHEGDRKIQEIFNSSQFLKTTLVYSCEQTDYITFILYNPKELPLKYKNQNSTELSDRLIFHTNPTLPPFLQKHFEELCTQKGIRSSGIPFLGPYFLSTLETLEPVKYDVEGDGKIREVFTFSQFLKTTLDYNFEGTTYKIFLLHNPERLPLKDKNNRSAQLSHPLVLFSDPKLPPLLKSHFEDLCNQNDIKLTDILLDPNYPSYKRSFIQEFDTVPVQVPTADQAAKQNEEAKPSLIERFFKWMLGG